MNTAYCQFAYISLDVLVTESITTMVNPGSPAPVGFNPSYAYFLISYLPCTCEYIYARDYSRCFGATFIVANHFSTRSWTKRFRLSFHLLLQFAITCFWRKEGKKGRKNTIPLLRSTFRGTSTSPPEVGRRIVNLITFGDSQCQLIAFTIFFPLQLLFLHGSQERNAINVT